MGQTIQITVKNIESVFNIRMYQIVRYIKNGQ